MVSTKIIILTALLVLGISLISAKSITNEVLEEALLDILQLKGPVGPVAAPGECEDRLGSCQVLYVQAMQDPEMGVASFCAGAMGTTWCQRTCQFCENTKERTHRDQH